MNLKSITRMCESKIVLKSDADTETGRQADRASKYPLSACLAASSHRTKVPAVESREGAIGLIGLTSIVESGAIAPPRAASTGSPAYDPGSVDPPEAGRLAIGVEVSRHRPAADRHRLQRYSGSRGAASDHLCVAIQPKSPPHTAARSRSRLQLIAISEPAAQISPVVDSTVGAARADRAPSERRLIRREAVRHRAPSGSRLVVIVDDLEWLIHRHEISPSARRLSYPAQPRHACILRFMRGSRPGKRTRFGNTSLPPAARSRCAAAGRIALICR